MTKIVLQLMGMKCWKCYRAMGALCIPAEVSETPETIKQILKSKKIRPLCEKCIITNPGFVSFEQVSKEI